MLTFTYTDANIRVESLKEAKEIQEKGVYVFRNKYDKPLYIGKAHYFPNRMSDYINGNHHLHFDPNEEVKYIDLYYIEAEEMRVAYEYFLINYLNPIYNTARVDINGVNVCIDREGLNRAGLKDDIDFIDNIDKVYKAKYVRLAKRYKIASNNLRNTNALKREIKSLRANIDILEAKNNAIFSECEKYKEIVNSFKQKSIGNFKINVGFSKNTEECICLIKNIYRENNNIYKKFKLNDFFALHDIYEQAKNTIDFKSNIYLQFNPEITFLNIVHLVKFLANLIDSSDSIDKIKILNVIKELEVHYNSCMKQSYFELIHKYNL